MTTQENNPIAMKKTARYQAMVSLEKAHKDNAFANKLVNEVLDSQAVAEVDRNLYTTLVYGSLQHYFILDAILHKMVSKPNKVKPWLWQLLILSLYQYYFLDNIPDHAITNEAVKITKKRGNYQFSKFVNGVIRNTMRKYPEVENFIDEESSDWRTETAYKYSLPLVWVDYFADRFGQEETENLAESLLDTPYLSVRIAKDIVDEKKDIKQLLEEDGFHQFDSEIAPIPYV